MAHDFAQYTYANFTYHVLSFRKRNCGSSACRISVFQIENLLLYAVTGNPTSQLFNAMATEAMDRLRSLLGTDPRIEVRHVKREMKEKDPCITEGKHVLHCLCHCLLFTAVV